MMKRLRRRLLDSLRKLRRRPILCRKCGGTLGHAVPELRDGRLLLRDFDATVRVRWTGEDELAFEHVRSAECER